MIFYLCPHCDKPAFYLHKRLKRSDRLCYQDIYTNGGWLPKLGSEVQCQMCMMPIDKLVANNVMDNLEYLESKI